MDIFGNSTDPIFFGEDAGEYRCYDTCNERLVIPARSNRKLIIGIRKDFGIDYTEYRQHTTRRTSIP